MNQLIPFIKILASALLSFVLTKIMAKEVIKFFAERKSGQQQREYLENHRKKSGTATNGGVSFVLPTLIATAAFAPKAFSEPVISSVIIVFISFFLIGLADDLLKLYRKKTFGLPGALRLFLEFLVALLALYLAGYSLPSLWYIELPVSGIVLTFGIQFVILLLFLIVGMGNASNLTDGLDGLVSGLMMMAFAPLLLVALKEDFSLAIFISSLIGGLLGFLKYNFHPAKLFMGDSGSLALGGALAMTAIVLKLEVVLIIGAALIIVEALSVIIQVASFKTTRKRIFLMAPLHHHFEKKGWPEWKVIMGYWLVGFLLSTVAIVVSSI